ncbi:MAG: methyltransferase domain-containing protein [Calothrix sp. MO_192.B10]|nr:methyltransferase domain-containing protein [Calothrix sp. MO_192.B10]
MPEKIGIKELEVLNIKWQLDHHFAKIQHRQEIVDSLNLQPGDVVLDLGCGPGLWSSMFAEKVQPHGRVIGVDIDARWIDYAVQASQENPFKEIIEYRIGDLHNLPFEDGTFDLVFVSGCSPYLADIHSAIEKQKRVTKKGGRIADRSWDGGMFFVHPISPYQEAKMMLAVAQAFEARRSDSYFDNYFGRKSHGIFKQAGLQDILTTSYAVQLVPPLSEEVKHYITGNSQFYAKIAAPYLSETELKQWCGHFDPSSDSYILDREDFYYCLLEVLTVGTVEN